MKRIPFLFLFTLAFFTSAWPSLPWPLRLTLLASSSEREAPLNAWLAEDIASAGAGDLPENGPAKPFPGGKETEWSVTQDARKTGGVWSYRAELYRHDWQVSEYTAFTSDTNDLRAAVRSAFSRFTNLIGTFSPATNESPLTNSRDTNDTAAVTSLATNTPAFVPPAGKKRFGGLITVEGGLNVSSGSNGGVLYYSGGVTYQQNLFAGMYLGWKTAYDHYTVSLTNVYTYRLDVWKNMMVLTYRYAFPYLLFFEAGIGFGGYFGRIIYHSSATNFTNSALGAAVEPKIGIGLYFGDWIVSCDMIYSFSLFNFNSANYPLMGLVAGAAVGWKF